MTMMARPTMTQTSIAMPNISPPVTAQSESLNLLRLQETHHHVQVADDPSWLAVPKKNLSCRRLDVDSLVGPHVSASLPDAANPIAEQGIPPLGRVFFDLPRRDRTQAHAERSDFETVTAEAVT